MVFSAHTVFFTAEGVIREWLKGVERAELGSSQTATATPSSLEEVWLPQTSSSSSLLLTANEGMEDYLGSLDWGCGSVADNARTVVDSLLRKDLQSVHSAKSLASSATRSHDPRVTMEMRHKKVSVTLS